MAGAAIVANPDEAAKIAGAVAALEKQGWTWFGLTRLEKMQRNKHR